MNITLPDTSGSPGLVRFRAETGGEVLDLEFRSHDVALVPSAEAAVAAFLLVAMSRDEDIEIDRPLDPRFRMNLDSVQDTYACWSPRMKRVEVRAPGTAASGAPAPNARPAAGVGPAPTRPPAAPDNRLTAAFCSGGIDSAYTLIKQMDRIDRLVFIHGFDLPLSDESGRQRASEGLGRLAAACGKRLIEVETNLREVIHLDRPSSRLGAWEFSHGSVLAAVAHVLSGVIDRIYVPATISYPRLNTWGSHPVLDPLWSSHRIELIHDGCEAGRFDKCTVVAEHPEIVEHIRVCWKSDTGAYNCGVCEKCVRTMVALTALGAFDDLNGRSPFAAELTPRLIRSVDVRRNGYEKYYTHAYADLKRRHPQLARSLLYAVATSRVRRFARSVRHRIKYGRSDED